MKATAKLARKLRAKAEPQPAFQHVMDDLRAKAAREEIRQMVDAMPKPQRATS